MVMAGRPVGRQRRQHVGRALAVLGLLAASWAGAAGPAGAAGAADPGGDPGRPTMPAVHVLLTDADRGRTVEVAVGSLVGIRLGAPPAGARWLLPTTDPPRGLWRSWARSDGSGAGAVIEVLAEGRYTVAGELARPCDVSDPPCAGDLRGFTVSLVATTPSSSPGPPGQVGAAFDPDPPADPMPGDLVLRPDDGGPTSGTVAAGARVLLRTAPPSSTGTTWTGARSDGLHPEFQSVDDRGELTVLRAVSERRATVQDVDDHRCLHGEPPCAVPQRLFSATVVVGSGQRRIDLGGPAPPVTAGNQPTVSGQVRSPDGRPAAGVQVEVSSDDGAAPVTTTSGGDGRFAVRVAPLRRTVYTVRADGAGEVSRLQEVATRVDLTAPAAAVAGQPVTARVRLLPALSAVGVGLATFTGGHWTWRATSVTDADGTVALSSPLPAGDQVLVAYVSARAGLLHGSRSWTVQVR